MQVQDWIMVIIVGISLICMSLMRWKKKNQMGKLIIVVPFLVAVLHLILCGWNLMLTLTYVSVLFMGLMIIFWKNKWIYRILLAVTFLTNGSWLGVKFVIGAQDIQNYASLGKVEALQHAIQNMKDNYVLNKHKEIDYEQIYNKCLPYFEAAEKSKDPVDEYIAWMTYCSQFHDGHVSALPILRQQEIMLEACKRLAGNDYGLSMIKLTEGEVVAILVEEGSEASQNGIHTGTVIKKWNGIEVEELQKSIEVCYPVCCAFPDAENEALYSAFFIPCGGGDTAKVTYVNDEGYEVTVTLNTIGNYAQRLNRAIKLFRHKGVDTENLHWEVLDGGHGYLYVKEEQWDTSDKGTFASVHKQIVEMIEQMNAQGVQDIIIDVRNNLGGYDEMGMAILSAFTNQSFFYYGDGNNTSNPGSYELSKSYYLEGEDHWGKKPIVVLCDNAVSAGDGLAYNFGKLDYVTVMGLAGSVGSFQSVGGLMVSGSGKNTIAVMYPVMLQLDEDASIMIDTDASRTATVVRDICVPLTMEAATSIFDEKKDYELEYAIGYLEE